MVSCTIAYLVHSRLCGSECVLGLSKYKYYALLNDLVFLEEKWKMVILVRVRRSKERREFVPENFKVAEFKEK